MKQACEGDPALQQEIESLLRHNSGAGRFLEVPAAAIVRNSLAEPASIVGRQLGPYQLLAPLGAGGMGEVYRAHDTKLGRDVAIKILPAHFTSDPERRARFAREARLLATLNHPHIGAIYGLEEADGLTALVLELVDGPTLAEWLERGPLPLDEAVAVARQIAEALEAAHERGIIHRDLKPSNIKLRPDGVVKVLDFGLANMLGPDVVMGDPEALTATASLETDSGHLMGTAAYMSPEQARGDPVDKRTDIWVFGSVFFELLTGEGAFRRETVGGTLAAVLAADAPWERIPAGTPAAIIRLLHRCLERDAKRRLRDIGEARIAIDDVMAGSGQVTVDPVMTTRRDSTRFAWYATLVSAIAVTALVVGTTSWFGIRLKPAVSALPLPITRHAFTPPNAAPLRVDGAGVLAVSPDGSRVAYIGGAANSRQVFVRALKQLDPTPVTETHQQLDHLFFSPNGQWVGFFSATESALKKVAVTGGSEVTLCRPDGFFGTTWTPDGAIVFATVTGLWRVSDAGGTPTLLAGLNRTRGPRDYLWRWPRILLGSSAVLLTVQPTDRGADQQVSVFDLRTGKESILVQNGSSAVYALSGHLVYAVGSTLHAVAFDPDRLETKGTAVPVLSQLMNFGGTRPPFAIADNGTLVYVPGGVRGAGRTLIWVDRQGREEAIKAPPRAYASPRISPDGTRVLVVISDQEDDIWIWNFARGTLDRLTFGPSREIAPLWTPEGRRVVFTSDREGDRNLFWRTADGTSGVERLTTNPNHQVPSSWSRDGTRLVFMEFAPEVPTALIMMTLDENRRDSRCCPPLTP